ncbi:MAG: hypothetical protein FJ031_07245 [Chloroflexi bacterium]|nr:hypothetical protein [Chloroflexota bacterium]
MLKRILPPLLLFILFMVFMALVQFGTPNLPDNDGFYHIKLTWLMRTEGLKPDFPWMQMTILNAEEFYDHHFLYHVVLIPFTFGDLLAGAKWSAVFFAAIAFLAVWYLFHRQQIPAAWLWALGLLAVSTPFLYRMSVTRAQSLSVGVLALGMVFLLEGKHKWLAVLSFLYVWMYDAFPLLLAFTVLHAVAIFLLEKRLEYRPLLWVGGGMLAGLIINPYFPDNLIFTYHHLLPKLLNATSISVGNEWYPYETEQLLENSPLALAAIAGGALALGLTDRKMDVRTAFSLLVALMFGVMLFKARRFIEYFAPFALVFSAFAWAPILRAEMENFVNSNSFSWLKSRFLHIVLVMLIGVGMFLSIPDARKQVAGSKSYDFYAGASDWLMRNTEPGERVFNTDWDDFPRLFFYNTHNTYIVGLDPTYMQLYDADLYDEWVAITRGNVDQPSQPILKRFSSRYIVTDLLHKNFLEKAAEDPNLMEVYRDDKSAVFTILAP